MSPEFRDKFGQSKKEVEVQKSQIEWCDYTSNPVKGYCPMGCSYCYARKIYDRFKWDKTIRFIPKEFTEWGKAKPHSKIFVGSTIELFHDKTIQYMPKIMEAIVDCPQHTFQLLTKQPQNLAGFSPFPRNCWVGVTACTSEMAAEAGFWLAAVRAAVKFISFEPLLERIAVQFPGFISDDVGKVGWLIIGSQTRPYKPPKIEWVQEIVEAADKAGVPMFLKDNLKPLLGDNLRQEFPSEQHA